MRSPFAPRHGAFVALLGFATVLFAFAAVADAAISIPTNNYNHFEDFNTLPATGSSNPWVDNSTLPNWYDSRTGNGTTINANNGSSNAGALYSYGPNGSNDRALGSIGSSNAAVGNMSWGALFQNNTGASLQSVDISYVGEQWRNSAAAAQTVSFYYKIDNTSTSHPPNSNFDLATNLGAWTAYSALDFTSPQFGGTVAGPIDGNDSNPPNRLPISSTLTFSSLVAPGQYVWIGWYDIDHGGADHGLSIDECRGIFHTVAAPVPEAASMLVWLGLCVTGLAGWTFKRRFA